MDYKRFLNYYGLHLQPPVIRQIVSATPSGVNKSASAGFPNPTAFPIGSATFDLKDGTQIRFTEEEMNVALQYGKSKGQDDFLDLLYKMQCEEHHPPTASVEAGPSKMSILMSPGAQMALFTFAMVCVSDGIPIIFSTPCFAVMSAPLVDFIHNALCVEVDADGTVPSSLRSVLSKWTPQDANNPQSGIPRILWLNPTCNNPAGVTTSAERRKEIYAIAQEYNLFIVEDDPYYYLQENRPRIPSYLSIDVDGRVLRFDSFSKVISPGLRCAYVTGPAEIVKGMEYVFMQSSQHVSVLSQMIIHKLLKKWGPAGFEDHVQRIVAFNREKRLHALAMADHWLKGFAEWNIPPGGMYIFLKVYDTGLTSVELNKKLMETHKVTVIPATGFYPKDAKMNDVAVLRVSIVMAEADEMAMVMKGLAQVIKEAQTAYVKKNDQVKIQTAVIKS
ncbi:kynurenine/alpha-aminoadipate aminotransferase, mitochondrial-like [Patiria miniata]|uniref:Aminotransferase class I/classII large domain-containing protein n=1 Tax=Patiria miniata TaxID=46514 RepID=A0A913ZUB1_PATMI|nr:kynurenine/alpha-aminoadipate aminotransferase, mitochondrial-like [Patiria miniata]